MNEPMVIPALYAPRNAKCDETCCVTCHLAPQECGRNCWTCAQYWADMRDLEAERREEMIDDAYQAARE